MKKLIAATMLFSVVGIAKASSSDEEGRRSQVATTQKPVIIDERNRDDSASPAPLKPVESISLLRRISNKTPDILKDSRVVATAATVGVYAAKNGFNSCPLSKDAQWPIAAGLLGYSAWKLSQSEGKAKKGLAVCCGVGAVAAAAQH